MIVKSCSVVFSVTGNSANVEGTGSRKPTEEYLEQSYGHVGFLQVVVRLLIKYHE